MGNNISIIIISNCNISGLRDNLPRLLTQQYDSSYEVIVVRESKRGESIDVITPLMAEHPHLSSTYLPDKPQYITDGDVAIMLGTKAAKYENVVIVHPDYEVPSDSWLKDVAAELGSPLTIGNPRYGSKYSWLKKFKHRKSVRKELKLWCSEHGVERSSLKASKEGRHLFTVAYKKSLYLSDSDIRKIISNHSNP